MPTPTELSQQFSKARIASSNRDPEPYFSAGKDYPVMDIDGNLFQVFDNMGRVSTCNKIGCSYLGGGTWEISEADQWLKP